MKSNNVTLHQYLYSSREKFNRSSCGYSDGIDIVRLVVLELEKQARPLLSAGTHFVSEPLTARKPAHYATTKANLNCRLPADGEYDTGDA